MAAQGPTERDAVFDAGMLENVEGGGCVARLGVGGVGVGCVGAGAVAGQVEGEEGMALGEWGGENWGEDLRAGGVAVEKENGRWGRMGRVRGGGGYVEDAVGGWEGRERGRGSGRWHRHGWQQSKGLKRTTSTELRL